MHKSPFYVVQDFLSPLLCEEIIDDLQYRHPDTDLNGIPVKTTKGNQSCEEMVFEHFHPHVAKIEQHYDVKYQGSKQMMFEWFPQGCDGDKPHCENSEYQKKQWVKVTNNDFTCVVFLVDYQEEVPFDSEFEVYGGKLEFPQYNFGFNPQRGTLILFPSGPNFINATAKILAGDLYQIRFHISTNPQYIHDFTKWPGNFVTWFEEIV